MVRLFPTGFPDAFTGCSSARAFKAARAMVSGGHADRMKAIDDERECVGESIRPGNDLQRARGTGGSGTGWYGKFIPPETIALKPKEPWYGTKENFMEAEKDEAAGQWSEVQGAIAGYRAAELGARTPTRYDCLCTILRARPNMPLSEVKQEAEAMFKYVTGGPDEAA